MDTDSMVNGGWALGRVREAELWVYGQSGLDQGTPWKSSLPGLEKGNLIAACDETEPRTFAREHSLVRFVEISTDSAGRAREKIRDGQ